MAGNAHLRPRKSSEIMRALVNEPGCRFIKQPLCLDPIAFTYPQVVTQRIREGENWV